jgi:hypothetical protein
MPPTATTINADLETLAYRRQRLIQLIAVLSDYADDYADDNDSIISQENLAAAVGDPTNATRLRNNIIEARDNLRTALTKSADTANALIAALRKAHDRASEGLRG